MKKLILIATLFTLALSPFAFAAPAQPPSSLQLTGTGGLDEPAKVIDLINRIANWIFAILLTVAVIYVLLAAYEYLTSGGGEGVEKGHKMLKWATVAIAVALLSKGFVNVIRVLVTNDALPR